MTGMRILVVGDGAREHTFVRALERGRPDSPPPTVYCAPGNGGTPNRLAVAATDVEGLVAACRDQRIDLVVIGPETALEAGVVDAMQVAGIPVFGPTRAAAQLEWSKGYARGFADRLGLASPRYAVFSGTTEAGSAIDWADAQPFDVVVKLDGLAAGKGVVVPASTHERNEAITSLLKRGPIVLEQLLVGEEVSLLAFCDGKTALAMPPAQDHKRIGEGDTGPNTGGMGAYAPAPCCPPEMVAELMKTFVTPTLDAMRAAGTPFVGVLFLGFMLTADGPRLLEFNARSGDPETSCVLPLLETPFLDIVEACVKGRLHDIEVNWKSSTACTVVATALGYPGDPRKGDPIALIEDPLIFHAGTMRGADGQLVTNGGRIVAATGIGIDLDAARASAYGRVGSVRFDAMSYRRDIGWRALARTSGGYAASGVDIDAGNDAVHQMKAAVESTHTPAVLAGVGAFGGAFDASRLKEFDQPVLVASTDGVGTKVMVASQLGRYGGLGQDLVNHCVNDVLVQRAEPLFFLDYIASSRLIPAQIAEIVSGMAVACRENGCVLLGGETAEMPGVYSSGHLDIAGTMVGVAERERLLPRPDVGPGDVLIGLASSGPHTNGYSLLRRVLRGLPFDCTPAGFDVSLGEALLAPHRSYWPILRDVLTTDLVKALVHITGGGLLENTPRALPAGLGADIALGSWPVPALFALVRDSTGLDADELHRTLNMGIGMVIICAAGDCAKIAELISAPTYEIGIVTDTPGVRLTSGVRLK